MTSLFSPAQTKTCGISGLQYWPDYIDTDLQKFLIDIIDHQPWRDDLKRRVQHYGYRYDYKARSIAGQDYLGALPDWLQAVAQRLCDDGVFAAVPDQVIVNEYLPGQGISAHIDCEPCFGEVIASLSLGSACVMQFEHLPRKEKQEQYLQPGSLVVLSGEARYQWTHAIPARKNDQIDGEKMSRERRLSLTFRNVVL